jgi:2-methylcitrate dehydratase PrpD
VLELAARVEHEGGSFSTFPGSFPASVRIELRDGTTRKVDVPYQRGGSDNPMTQVEVRAKFQANAALALGPAQLAALESGVLSLESVERLREALPLGKAV